jgi:hypothetical protein
MLRSMRLLDLISQGHCARVRTGDGDPLPTAERFAADILSCASRYVLTDQLVRCATRLAYAEGDRLIACADLIRAPARCLWVEWADAPRQEELHDIPSLNQQSDSGVQRVGALLHAAADCRAGSVRTFWSTREGVAFLSPVITLFDMDKSPERLNVAGGADWSGAAVLRLPEEPAIDDLLAHLRFQFDAAWSAHYSRHCTDAAARLRLLKANLAGCAFDMPMLMAFFLLLAAKNLLPRRQVDQQRLNRRRGRTGKKPLLEHVEVSAPQDIAEQPTTRSMENRGSTRSGARLHHVRGHLVRRGAAVYWRSPHLRGTSRLGLIRSRTVVLTFSGHAGPGPARQDAFYGNP